MATAKKTAPQRRPLPNTTQVRDSGAVVERGEEVKIQLPSVVDDEDPDEEMVTVVVPHRFMLTLDNRQTRTYEAGVQEMRVSHASHWWSQAQGVKVYDPKA